MKRVISLDIWRGIAIMCMIAFHTIEIMVTSYDVLFEFIFSQHFLIMILLSPLMIAISWRGFFLIISAAGHAYSMQRKFSRESGRVKILLRQIIGATLLFIHGLIIQVIWNPYSSLADLIYTGSWNIENYVRFLYFSDAIGNIAISAIITSIIMFFLTMKNGAKKPVRNAIILVVLSVIVFALWQPLELWFTNTTGLTPANVRLQTPANLWESIRLIFYAHVIGYQQSLFPYLGVYFLGTVFGILLSQTRLNRKKTVIISFVLSFLIAAAGLVLWAIDGFDMAFMSGFMIAPLWFLLVNTAVQLLILCFSITMIELSRKKNRNLQKSVKYSSVFRRFGLFALTMYTLQILDVVPKLFVGWIMDTDLMGIGITDNIGLIFLTSLLTIVWWYIILRLWEKIKYIGTIEWFFKLFDRAVSRKSFNPMYLIDTEELLHNVEPVRITEERKTEK